MDLLLEDNHNPLLNQGFSILAKIFFLSMFNLFNHQNMFCREELGGRETGWPLHS
jgi:hypothetical protein